MNNYEEFVIFKTIVGSQCYGLDDENSDTDEKGVLVPPKDYFLGFSKRIEQVERKEPNDLSIYDIRKFFHLAGEKCNPTTIELLYVDERFHQIRTKYWEKIIEHRDKFLSGKAVYSFSGYAFDQIRKLKTHRAWLLSPLKAEPTREGFGLDAEPKISNFEMGAINVLIDKKIREWLFEGTDYEANEKLPKGVKEKLEGNIKRVVRECWMELNKSDIDFDMDMTLFRAVSRKLNFEDNFLEYLDKEKRYASAKRYWKQYLSWKTNRNPKRAETEARTGYDLKYASHAIRLGLTGLEIVRDGRFNVYRGKDSPEWEVKQGLWSYDRVMGLVERLHSDIFEIYDTGRSPLPKTPDINFLDKVCSNITEEVLDEREGKSSVLLSAPKM